jgi:hypothetical protein
MTFKTETETYDHNEPELWDDLTPEDAAEFAAVVRALSKMRPEVRKQAVKALRALFTEPEPNPVDRVLATLVPLLPSLISSVVAPPSPFGPHPLRQPVGARVEARNPFDPPPAEPATY